MNTHTWLRLIHIVSGVLWTGTAVFAATMLVPAVRAAGPSGGAVMKELMQNRKMPIVMMIISWLTLLSGLSLAYIDAGPLGFRWFERGAGLVFGLGAVSAFVGGMAGMIISAPAGKRMSAIMSELQGRGPTESEAAEIRKLQGKLSAASIITATLLLLATALMAVARSFG